MALLTGKIFLPYRPHISPGASGPGCAATRKGRRCFIRGLPRSGLSA